MNGRKCIGGALVLFFFGFSLWGGGRADSGQPDIQSQAQNSVENRVSIDLERVALYSSGVGYFEHRGEVRDNGVLSLSFQPEQMNDVLKSLVIRDFNGGRIGGVVYPGQDPVERTLGTFAVDLGGDPVFADILSQLRGVELTMTPGPGLKNGISGRLVSVEQQFFDGGPRTVLSLQGPLGLRLIHLEDAGGIIIHDVRLQNEFSQALDVLRGRTSDQGRPLSINLEGQGTRSIGLSYVTEAPVWKTSYRLDLGELTGSGEVMIQGWAIVENTSDSDWNDVQLSLVTGSPVSFIQDLVTPLYIDRPVIQPRAGEVVRAQTYDSEIQFDSVAESRAPAPAMAYRSTQENLPMAFEEQKAGGVVASAQAQQSAEQFRFTLTDPVSIPRRQSALIPLVVQDIQARSLSIFTGQENSLHPMAGVRLGNSSGTRLPAGPMTVYRAGLYAGDALVESWAQNEDRIITYARDLDLKVSVRASQEQEISRLSLIQGVLNIDRRIRFTRELEISNSAETDKYLLVEHPRTPGRELDRGASPEESNPVETTPGVYRFAVELKPESTRSFTISESQITSQTLGLLNARAQQFFAYISEGAISPEVKTALETAAGLRQEVDRWDTVITAINQDRTTAINNQARTRSNLESVGRDSTQGRSFLERLLELENEINRADQEIVRAREQQAQARRAFEQFIQNLSVE